MPNLFSNVTQMVNQDEIIETDTTTHQSVNASYNVNKLTNIEMAHTTIVTNKKSFFIINLFLALFRIYRG